MCLVADKLNHYRHANDRADMQMRAIADKLKLLLAGKLRAKRTSRVATLTKKKCFLAHSTERTRSP